MKAQRAGLYDGPYSMAGGAGPSLRSSPAESALAASAFSVSSLDSWERARCQKCLQVNSLSLSSASDLTLMTYTGVYLLLGRIIS